MIHLKKIILLFIALSACHYGRAEVKEEANTSVQAISQEDEISLNFEFQPKLLFVQSYPGKGTYTFTAECFITTPTGCYIAGEPYSQKGRLPPGEVLGLEPYFSIDVNQTDRGNYEICFNYNISFEDSGENKIASIILKNNNCSVLTATSNLIYGDNIPVPTTWNFLATPQSSHSAKLIIPYRHH